MADNVPYTPGAGAKVAAREVSYSGETALAQVVGLATFSGADDAKTITDIDASNPLPIKAMGELIEAIEAMRMAIQSLNRTVGMAQVNPLTGRMLVDGSGVAQPITGTVTATQGGTWNLNNLAQVGGQNANSQIPSFERMTADNLRRNISVT